MKRSVSRAIDARLTHSQSIKNGIIFPDAHVLTTCLHDDDIFCPILSIHSNIPMGKWWITWFQFNVAHTTAIQIYFQFPPPCWVCALIVRPHLVMYYGSEAQITRDPRTKNRCASFVIFSSLVPINILLRWSEENRSNKKSPCNHI